MAGIPNGRFSWLPGLGISTPRTAGAWYLPDLALSSSDFAFSSRFLPSSSHPPRTGSQFRERCLFSVSDRPPLATLGQCNDEGALWTPSGVALQFPLFVVVSVGTYKLILPPCVRFVSHQRFHNPTPSFPTHRFPRVGFPDF